MRCWQGIRRGGGPSDREPVFFLDRALNTRGLRAPCRPHLRPQKDGLPRMHAAQVVPMPIERIHTPAPLGALRIAFVIKPFSHPSCTLTFSKLSIQHEIMQ